MNRLNADTVEVINQLLAELINLHVSDEVDDFLAQISSDLGEVEQRLNLPQVSTVEIEEIEEVPEPPTRSAPPPSPRGPSPLRRPKTSSPTSVSGEGIRAPTEESTPNVDSARAATPPSPPPSSIDEPSAAQSPKGATVPDAVADWACVEAMLKEARDLSRASRASELAALTALEDYLQRHGAAGERQAGRWPELGRGRREELAAVAQVRAARARRAAEAKRKAEEEEARRAQNKKKFEEARRAREKAEAALRKAKEDAQRRLAAEEKRAAAAREAERAAAKDVEGHKCYMCGEPGVKKSKHCPNKARHRPPRGPQKGQ